MKTETIKGKLLACILAVGVLLTVFPAVPALATNVLAGNVNHVPAQGADLSSLVAASGVSPGSVTELEITGGHFTTSDWSYTAASLPKLDTLLVTDSAAAVDDVPSYQFWGNSTLKRVEIAKMTGVGPQAFFACTKLASVKFPDVTSIGKALRPSGTGDQGGSFAGCSVLVLTPESFPKATMIGTNSFEQCTALTNIGKDIFPKATQIGQNAFLNCGNLTSATFLKAAGLGFAVFYKTGRPFTLTLPAVPPTSSFYTLFDITPNNPLTDVTLVIADESGVPLTGEALNNARIAYAASNDTGDEGINDATWFGMSIGEITHKLTFQTNGGAAIASQDVPRGEKLAALPTLDRDGYKFTGWYKDTALTQKWALGTDTVGLTDFTLYAGWTPINGNVNVIPPDPETGLPVLKLPEDSDLLDASLTEEDKTLIQNGSSINLYIRLTELKDSVPEEDKTAISILAGDQTVGLYLDLSLFKQIDNEPEQRIHQLSKKTRFVLDVPEELLKLGSNFTIARTHNDGSTDILEDLDTNPKTITFETDRFSTYAILYTPNQSLAATGDSTAAPLLSLFGLSFLGFGAVLLLRRIKHR